MPKITTRIKELRARHDMTQDELALAAGITRQTLLHLEKGRYNPSLILAWKIAKALHSSISDVFIIEEE